MARYVKGQPIPQPDQNEPYSTNRDPYASVNPTQYEPSAFATTPDNYVAIDAIPAHYQIGAYRLARGYRRHVNDPGALRWDGVSSLLSRWNAPPYTQFARYQGKVNVNVGGAVYSPLASYDAQVMSTSPPPANRAAFTSAVQRFLTTRGSRANGIPNG